MSAKAVSSSLPARENLQWYRKAAKKKLVELRVVNPKAKLSAAQLAIAQKHGQKSWRILVAAIESASKQMSSADVFPDAAKAIIRRDLETLRALVTNVPDVLMQIGKHPNWDGEPQLLHVAIEAGDDGILRFLLDAGADPSGVNDRYGGWSPLMLAVHWKRSGMRDMLIAGGAAIGLYEALMLHDDVRALPLIEKTDPAERGPNKGTPLHFARTPAAAKALLARGVDVHATDQYGRTALDSAAGSGEAVADVFRRAGMRASAETYARIGDLKSLCTFKPEWKLFQPAIEGDQIAVVRWLVASGVDVNGADDKGATALHSAAFWGRLAIVKLLAKAGADVHAEDDAYNSTPTGWAQHAAQNFNRVECVAVAGFLQKQEEKKWSVKNLPAHRQSHKVAGWKPIMDAAFEGNARKIQQLIKGGADPNATSTTPGAHRPLHRLIESKKTAPRGPKHDAALKALLAGGADPHLRGGLDRLTALQMAALDSPRFVPLLADAFEPLDIFHACVLLDLKRVTALLKKEKSLATTNDENKYTPLHYVAGSRMYLESKQLAADQLSLAQLLLDAGAGANDVFPWIGPGNWPIPVLYMACGRNDNAPLTDLLMQAGAMPFDNESVYHAADEGHVSCLAVIERYADPKKLADECTKCLRTQMHWGRSRGAKWLLEHGADPNSLHPQFGNSALHQAVLLGSNDQVFDLLLGHHGDPAVRNASGKDAITLAAESKNPRIVNRLATAGRSAILDDSK